MSSVLQKASALYIVCLVGVTKAGLQKSAASISEFSEFAARFNKDYSDALEADKHLNNFLVNKARIEAKNTRKTKAKFVLDSFADLSDEEFLKQKTGASLQDDD